MATDAAVLHVRQQLGARIRELRLERGWTQETLAERAGLHPKYPGPVERGRDIRLSTARAIAAAFDLTLAELVSDLPPTSLH